MGDPRLAQEAQDWIEAVAGVAFPGGFAESLKDGVILCKCATAVGLVWLRRVAHGRSLSLRYSRIDPVWQRSRERAPPR